MLVLARRETEEILIGENIRVIVNRISGDTVRIGVIAPSKIPVWRKEIVDRMRRKQQREAGGGDKCQP